jgi:hypothetical protein
MFVYKQNPFKDGRVFTECHFLLVETLFYEFKDKTSMPPVGFEPAILASARTF